MSLLAGLCAESQELGNIAPTAELSLNGVTIRTETPANTNITRVFALEASFSELTWAPPELAAGLATGWLSFWYKREDASGQTVYEQFELLNGTDLAFKFTTLNNTLQAVDADGVVHGLTSPFTSTTTSGAGWEHVVVEWSTHATAGEIRVYRDGVLDLEVIGINTKGSGAAIGPTKLFLNGSFPDLLYGSLLFGDFTGVHNAGQVPAMWITRHMPIADATGNLGTGGFANINETPVNNAQVHAFTAAGQTAGFYVDPPSAGVYVHGVWQQAVIERGDTTAGTQLKDEQHDGTLGVTGSTQVSPTNGRVRSSLSELNPNGDVWDPTDDFGSAAGATAFGWTTVT